MIPASNYIMLSSSYEIQLKIDPVVKFTTTVFIFSAALAAGSLLSKFQRLLINQLQYMALVIWSLSPIEVSKDSLKILYGLNIMIFQALQGFI
jgi:hypothetical protein